MVVMAPGRTQLFKQDAKIERCLNCYYVLFAGRTCASKREKKVARKWQAGADRSARAHRRSLSMFLKLGAISQTFPCSCTKQGGKITTDAQYDCDFPKYIKYYSCIGVICSE